MNKDLPEMCYSISETTKEIIAIKRGETGYYPVSLPWRDMTITQLESYANNLNDMLGILPEERIAMEVGSMFGWHLLGADPQSYLDKAVLLSKKEIKAHMKDSNLSILYPVKGDLYEYHLLGEKRCFFSWESLPKELAGRKMVVIDGKRLMPVDVMYSQNGSITLLPKGRGRTKKREQKAVKKERRTER